MSTSSLSSSRCKSIFSRSGNAGASTICTNFHNSTTRVMPVTNSTLQFSCLCKKKTFLPCNGEKSGQCSQWTDTITCWVTEKLWFDSWMRQMCLFSTASRSRSGGHPASHSIHTGGKGRGNEPDHGILTSIQCQGSDSTQLYIHSAIYIHGMVLNAQGQHQFYFTDFHVSYNVQHLPCIGVGSGGAKGSL